MFQISEFHNWNFSWKLVFAIFYPCSTKRDSERYLLTKMSFTSKVKYYFIVNLPVVYHKCYNAIGYATYYLFHHKN